MRNLLLVGTGGFLGAVSRYYLSGLVLHATGAARFPWATLVVNVTGCFAIGLLAGAAETAQLLSPAMRLLLITGFLGGYTTFSAFGYETYFLGREQLWLGALMNVTLQVVLGLAAVVLGHRLAVALA